MLKTDSDRLLGMIGLAARARKITFGTDMTCEALSRGKVFMVILSEEASANTVSKIKHHCEIKNTELHAVPFDPSDIARAIGKSGKRVMSVGVTDISFANGLKKMFDEFESINAHKQTTSESEV